MTRREQAEASRAALVAAARVRFAADGYDATTVAAILETAGMARGALYHYFPEGKRQIFQAVFDTINDEFHRRRDSLSALGSPLARVRGGVRVFMELCTEDDFARVALLDAPRLVAGQAEPGSTYELLRDQLAEAVAAGEVRPLDVDVTARALYGAVRAAGEHVVSAADRRRAATEAAHAIDLLLDGLEAR